MLSFPGQYYFRSEYPSWSAKTTWKEIFGFIAPYLIEHPHDDTVRRVLKDALAQKYGSDFVTEPNPLRHPQTNADRKPGYFFVLGSAKIRNSHKLAPFAPFNRLLRVARFGFPLPFGG